MTDTTEPQPAPAVGPRGSKGVAFTNWLVSKASGALDKRSSRRGFLIGSAMAGSAVAVAGTVPITHAGAAYTHITDCGAGSFCADGYTEFCCALTGGLNVCPSDSFAGGWWRADYSSFCNGTRYYIDCMQYCQGPPTGYQNFCAGSQECRCADGCGTRKVYCNYFRYGQCHTEIGATGPIACRIVTCVPPYTVAEWACSTAAAVDNSTAEHSGHCAPPPPPAVAAALPDTGGAVQDGAGRVSIFVRGLQGHVHVRDFVSGSWSGWNDLGGVITSGVAAATFGGTTYVIARGGDKKVYGIRRDGNAWSSWHLLGGVADSDPVAASDGGGIVVSVRGGDDAIYANRFNGASWTGWIGGGGRIDSEPSQVWDNAAGIQVVARGVDGRVYANRFGASSFQSWVPMGGLAASDPSITTSPLGVFSFVRGTDSRIYWNRMSGASWAGWIDLGGIAASDPIAFSDSAGVHVLVRGSDNALYHNLRAGTSWTGWIGAGGRLTANPTVATGPSGSFVFVRGDDGALWYGRLDGVVWSGWSPLDGQLAPMRATP